MSVCLLRLKTSNSKIMPVVGSFNPMLAKLLAAGNGVEDLVGVDLGGFRLSIDAWRLVIGTPKVASSQILVVQCNAMQFA
jgi:hypothetical protein